MSMNYVAKSWVYPLCLTSTYFKICENKTKFDTNNSNIKSFRIKLWCKTFDKNKLSVDNNNITYSLQIRKKTLASNNKIDFSSHDLWLWLVWMGGREKTRRRVLQSAAVCCMTRLCPGQPKLSRSAALESRVRLQAAECCMTGVWPRQTAGFMPPHAAASLQICRM